MTAPLQIHEELVWVLVNGELCNVSDFAHLKSKERPEAICPVCQTQVTMKLGSIKKHHYAHAENVECVFLRIPESVLHFNTKVYLAKFLLSSKALSIDIKCANRDCSNIIKHKFFENWDDVKVEYIISGYRPDIALLSDKKVIGAIEVVVTHPMDKRKENFFIEQGLRWIEFNTTEEFINKSSSWSSDLSLPNTTFWPAVEPMRCNTCQANYEFWRQQSLKVSFKSPVSAPRKPSEARKVSKPLKLSKPQNSVVTKNYAISIVDIYSFSGHYQRWHIILELTIENDKCVTARIINNGQTLFIEYGNPEISKDQITVLSDKTKSRLKGEDGIYDVLLNWNQEEENLQNSSIGLKKTLPPRYSWDSIAKTWIKKLYKR
jgi:ssDNA-binding Zn-finger/Zn-ribbon topoisomerase 1